MRESGISSFKVGDKIVAICNGLDYMEENGFPIEKQEGQKRGNGPCSGKFDYKKGDMGRIINVSPAGSIDIMLYGPEVDGIKYFEATSKNWRLELSGFFNCRCGCRILPADYQLESQLERANEEMLKSFQKRTGRLIEIGMEEQE